MRTPLVPLASVLIVCASSASAQSLGDIVGAIAGIGEASMLEASRAPDTPFRKDARDQDRELAGKLGKLLPPGTDPRAAATGFRNLGEFVTTVRVSSNLAIPFDQLKARVVAGNDVSDAIEILRPEVDGLVEARRARMMAREDLARA